MKLAPCTITFCYTVVVVFKCEKCNLVLNLIFHMRTHQVLKFWSKKSELVQKDSKTKSGVRIMLKKEEHSLYLEKKYLTV